MVKTKDVETEATFVNVVPPDGRRENVAVWLLDVVGQFDTTSSTHVYVPRKVTKSLYWTVETDGAPIVNPRVAALTAAGAIRTAARTAIWAVATNRTRLRPRIPFT